MLMSGCCSGKLDNNNTRATVGGRDTVSLVKIYPSLSARDFYTLGPSSPLLTSPNTQSSEGTRHGRSPERGGLQRAPGMGGRGTLTKDAASALPPSLPPSSSTSYIGSSSKARMYLHYCLGGDEIAKSMHRPSRSSPAQGTGATSAHAAAARTAPSSCRRPCLSPGGLLPAGTAAICPQQPRARPRLLGPLPPPPRRIRCSVFSLEPRCRRLIEERTCDRHRLSAR